MTSSPTLGTMEPGDCRASTTRLPVAPPVVPARPEVAPIVPAGPPPTPPGTRRAPTAIAPSIAPGEVEISVWLPGTTLGFDHGEGCLANCSESFRNRRRVRGRWGRTCRTFAGGTRHGCAKQHRCANCTRGNDHGNDVQVSLPQPHRKTSSNMVGDAIAGI